MKLSPYIVGLCVSFLTLPGVGTAQITFSVDSLAFNPTTIDSTTTLEVTITNTLAVPQEVTLNGIVPPFSTPLNPITVPGEGSTLALLSFAPVSINTFPLDIIATGSVFGSDTLNLLGEGTLPGATLLIDSVDFGTKSVNSLASMNIPIASTGLGTLFIDSVTSTNPIIFADGNLSIASGDTSNIVVNFYSEFSGNYEVSLTIYTSDPFNPTLQVTCLINAISAVSGEVCGTWSLINSPYQLTDNVIVPLGCTLTVEAGVIIQGDSLDIEVFGSFFSNGTLASPVTISLGEFISHSPSQNVVLNHTQLTEVNEVFFVDMDYRIIRDLNTYSQDSLAYYLDSPVSIYVNENPLVGKYIENFSDNNCQGWEMTYENWPCPSIQAQTCNGNSLNRVYDTCNNSYWGWIYTSTPIFTLNTGELPTSVSFFMDTYQNWYGYDSTYIDYKIQFSLDGGLWVDLENSGSSLNNATKTFDLAAITPQSTIQFRFGGHFQSNGTLTIDNFKILTNFYLGVDAPAPAAPAAAAAAATFSTGGIELHNSQFTGDFHSVSDSINVVLDNSQIIGNASRNKDSHGLGLYADYVNVTMTNSTISGHSLDGIHIEATISDATMDGCDISSNGTEGVKVLGTLILDADSTFWHDNAGNGIEATGDNSSVILYQTRTFNNLGKGVLLSGSNAHLEGDYSFVRDNAGDGIEMGPSGTLRLDNCMVGYNNGPGIWSGGAVDLNYCNIIHNGGYGIYTSQFSTVDNSIIWFNGGVPQMMTSNVYAISYTNVQGINALQTSIDFAWGDGCIGTDPALADVDGHIDPYSPCVDGGMPWEQDAHIPYGLGSSRADMGMYGGPSNDYWGGQSPPNGSVTVTDIFDIPEDEGGYLGIHFTASPFDFGGLGFNVTHYSIWRDLNLGSAIISPVETGNWEQIGNVPAQGFIQYGYTASTLIDALPGDTACLTSYIVIAHTTDDNIYWVSDVVGACSVDNLSPAPPILNGMVLDVGGEEVAQIVWSEPLEADYSYTEITSSNGFQTIISGDTSVVDATVMPGNVYIYEAVHYDIHGNASPVATTTVEISSASDIIPLAPGWNLISTDRIPTTNGVTEIFSQLIPGNLNYVIGFNDGVTYYDPAGLSFLNTLSTLNPGSGYWLKVSLPDTLVVTGTAISETFMPQLSAGWNLIAYPPQAPSAPNVFFESLLLDGNLLYVTGFDEGSLIYDPNGLPFLQTLLQLQNSFGYWVKTAWGTGSVVLLPEDETPETNLQGAMPTDMQISPAFEVLNGVCNLKAGVVSIVANMKVVGYMEVLPGGYLMTSVIYGDDLATVEIEGIEIGSEISFLYDGCKADQIITFQGGMSHKALNLNFETSTNFKVYPNPITDEATCSFTLDYSGRAHLVVTDVLGRTVIEIFEGELEKGIYDFNVSTVGLESGTFVIHLYIDGEELSSRKVIKHSR